MKKIFTLATAILASFSLWASTSFSADEIVAGKTVNAVTVGVNGLAVGANKQMCKNEGTAQKFSAVEGKATANTVDENYVEIKCSTEISFLKLHATFNSSGTGKKMAFLYWGENATPTYENVLSAELVTFVGYDGACDANYVEINVPKDARTIRIYRQLKNFNGTTYEKNKNYGEGQTFLLENIEIEAAPTCNKPEKELVLKADKEAPIYVGDEVTFSTEGGNSNTPVIAGDAGEEINAGKWIATEGKHTFTATQEAEGETCAQEAVLELTVLTKNPVTAVTIAGEKEGFIGEPYTYTATAANATDYAWYVDGVSANTNAAEFTYTPSAAGAYSIVCKARNEFNAADEWIASDPIELKVTKKVVVMEDTYIWKKGSGYTGCVENPNVDANANQAETELAYSKAAFSGMSKMGRASADNAEISLTFTAKEGMYIKSICTYGKLEEPEGAQIAWDGKNWENLAAYSEGEKSFEAPAETFPETFTIKFIGVSKDSGGLWWRNALVTLGEKESPTAIENTEASVKAVKVIRDGQLYIMHNGRMYNVQGAVVR